ncbi:MAG: hypothetical protein AAF525_02200 [Pseudomonadota bacterium]
MTFHPSRFWRSEDWESSTDRPRQGYIEELLLYAGDLDEISIHLFPRVRTVRVRSKDAASSQLRALDLACSQDKAAYIFIECIKRETVERFTPTIYEFRASGFCRVRRGEYVSRRPQQAIAKETVSLTEAIDRWHIEACYVTSLDVVISKLKTAGIYFEEQT